MFEVLVTIKLYTQNFESCVSGKFILEEVIYLYKEQMIIMSTIQILEARAASELQTDPIFCVSRTFSVLPKPSQDWYYSLFFKWLS